VKIVLITAGGVALLALVLFIGYVFAGFPLSILVNKIVKDYVSETYSEFDVTADPARYDWYDGKYIAKVYDRSDKEIYFEVWYIKDRGIEDRYTYGEFWGRKFKKMLMPLLKEEFSDEFVSFYVSISGIKIGQLFDKDASVIKKANIVLIQKDTEPSTLADQFVKYNNFMEKNGFNFTSYNLIFRRTDGGSSIWVKVRREHINNGLAELIEYMQGNLDERGWYFDSSNGLRYRD